MTRKPTSLEVLLMAVVFVGLFLFAAIIGLAVTGICEAYR